MNRRLAVLAVLALLGAGCGSDAADNGSTSTSTSSTTDRLTKQEQGVKWAECMRSNGVPDFPDPDPSGDVAYGVSVTPEVFTRAATACKELQPPGALSSKRSPKEQTDSLRFAACVRENGVEDFPDPVNGEPLIDTTKIPSSNRPGGMTILNAATEKCGGILDLPGGPG